MPSGRRCARTPVENRLAGVWSITDFVLPSRLETVPEVERRHPDTLSGAQLVEPTISPLMLRPTVTQFGGHLWGRYGGSAGVGLSFMEDNLGGGDLQRKSQRPGKNRVTPEPEKIKDVQVKIALAPPVKSGSSCA